MMAADSKLGFMMVVAYRVVIAACSLAALSVAAQAQQSSPSSTRLMFDPTGRQDQRRPQPQPQQATTTGQSAQKPQPAAAQPVRQTVTPPQQTAAPKPAPRRPAPTLASEPTDPNRSAERP